MRRLMRIAHTTRTMFTLSLIVAWAILPLSSMADDGADKTASLMNQAPRFLALGDSYTIGEGVNKSERWPTLLQARLAEQGINISEPEVIARTGWRAAQLLDAISQKQSNKSLNPPYQLVALMIGVNDQYQGSSVAEFKPDLERLINMAIELAAGKPEQVLLISIPDWGFSPFSRYRDSGSVSTQIDAFNAELKKMADQYSLTYVDVTGISRQVKTADFAADGLHPSKQQHQRWVDEAILSPALKVFMP